MEIHQIKKGRSAHFFVTPLNGYEILLWRVALGVHDGEVAALGMARLVAVEHDASDLLTIVRALIFPITHKITGFLDLSGSMAGQPRTEPHAALPGAKQLIGRLLAQLEPNSFDRLQVFCDALSLGMTEFSADLANEIESAWDRRPVKYWKSYKGQGRLSHALYTLSTDYLSRPLIEDIVIRGPWNEASSARKHLAEFSLELSELIELHEKRSYGDNVLYELIRRAAIAEGVHVRRVDNRLIIETPNDA